MSGLDNTGKGQDAPHQPGESIEFKAVARRNKLAGLWAAELLGLIGQAAKDYAKGVKLSAGHHKGDEEVVSQLAKDLAGKADHQTIRHKLAELLHIARRQVQDEDGKS